MILNATTCIDRKNLVFWLACSAKGRRGRFAITETPFYIEFKGNWAGMQCLQHLIQPCRAFASPVKPGHSHPCRFTRRWQKVRHRAVYLSPFRTGQKESDLMQSHYERKALARKSVPRTDLGYGILGLPAITDTIFFQNWLIYMRIKLRAIDSLQIHLERCNAAPHTNHNKQ
jgi:hypothetical protein